MAKMTHADKDKLIEELQNTIETLTDERDNLATAAEEWCEAWVEAQEAMAATLPSLRTIRGALKDLGVAIVNLFRSDKQ